MSATPFDPRRAVEALGEIGWRRGADGNMANAAGEHVTIPLWTTQGGQWEAEIAITADNWRAIGLGVDEYVIPGPQSRDRELPPDSRVSRAHRFRSTSSVR